MAVANVIISNTFKEIMSNFSNPLEVIREAIQNSYDAKANKITIDIKRNITSMGESLDIIIEDDGVGLLPDKFKNFFNLGDSTKINDPTTIGEKGHGTKIFYNSNMVSLESWVDSKKYISILELPYKMLFEGKELEYSDPKEVENVEHKNKGTRVTIAGYLKNISEAPFDKFSHPAVKDYILWSTVFASIENQLHANRNCDKIILLRSYDSDWKVMQEDYQFNIDENGFEKIKFGHIFPTKELTDKHEMKKEAMERGIRNWEDLFCKRMFCKDVPIDGLPYPIQVIIWAEGDKFKRLYNPLIRERIRTGGRDFEYKVGDRYGFWACKNYIPIQNIDNWITGKGNYTKFHAFVNFDGFSLTANRSSIENTKPEFIIRIKQKLDNIFDDVIKNKAYIEWTKMEEGAKQERTASEEKYEFGVRLRNCKKKKKIKVGNVEYFEPEYEGEVALLFGGLLQVYPEILNYEILDYSTHKGIDFLVRRNNNIPIENDNTIGYIELKYNLEKGRFNHTFENLREIVCYNTKGLRNGDILCDLEENMLEVKKDNKGWFLLDSDNMVGHNIKILVIEELLKEYGIYFA